MRWFSEGDGEMWLIRIATWGILLLTVVGSLVFFIKGCKTVDRVVNSLDTISSAYRVETIEETVKELK